MTNELEKFVNGGLLTKEEAERIENDARIDAMKDIAEDVREEMKEIERDYDELVGSDDERFCKACKAVVGDGHDCDNCAWCGTNQKPY